MGKFDEYLERISRKTIQSYVEPRFKFEFNNDESITLRFDQLAPRLHRLKPETWFIYSPAGSGKTTLIWHLMAKLLSNEEATACIRIDKENIERFKSDDVHDFIRKLCPNTVDIDLWKSRSRKQKAKIVIFIDAINEIYAIYKDTEKWTFVRNLLEGNHRFCVLATSRYKIDTLSDNERDIQHLSIQPLKEYEIEAYIEANDLSAQQTIEQINATGMMGMASNPFLLSLFIQLASNEDNKNKKWPKSRAELLQKAWTNNKINPQHLSVGLSNQALLSCISLISVSLGKKGEPISFSNVTRLLEEVWSGEKKLIDEAKDTLLDHHFIQIEENEYQLLHDSFIELGLAMIFNKKYIEKAPLIALYSSQLDTFVGDWVALHETPDKAALLMAKIAKDAQSNDILIDIIVADSGVLTEDTLRELWKVVGYGLSGNSYLSQNTLIRLQSLPLNIIKQGLRFGLLLGWQKLNPDIADKLRSSFISGKFSSNTFETIRRYQLKSKQRINYSDKHTLELNKEASISILTSSKNKPDDRKLAANYLSKLSRETSIIELLRDLLLKDIEDIVRGSCAMALGNIGDKQAVEVLLKALLTDIGPRVRGSCATALGNIGDKQAVEALSKVLLTDEDPVVRGSCATALGNIGDKKAVKVLSKALLSDEGFNVRGSCATALGNIGDKQAVEALSKVLLADKSPDVRGSCATALGNIGDKQAVEALSKVLLTDKSPDARGSCAMALGNIGDKQAVEALSKLLLTDEDPVVRGSCATALGNIGDKQAVEALSKLLLTDEDPIVRGSCATALGNIGDKQAVEALSKLLLTDEDPVVRGSCATALGNIGDKKAVKVLSKALLSDEGFNVRVSSATALGKMPFNDQLIKYLKEAFFSPQINDQVRINIAISYVRLKGSLDKDFYLYIRKRYNGKFPDKKLQGKIIELLASNAPDKEACNFLDEIARKDFDYRNRTMAVKGLSEAGKLNESLIRYLIDPKAPDPYDRPRDTYRGVLGVTAAAIVEQYANQEKGKNNFELLNLVIHLFLKKETYLDAISPAFNTIRHLKIEKVSEIFDFFELKLSQHSEPNRIFVNKFNDEQKLFEIRKQVAIEFKELTDSPQSFLKVYKDQVKPEIEKILERKDELKKKNVPKVALITVTDTETETFLDFIKEKNFSCEREKFGNRYYHQFTLTTNEGNDLEIIRIQPTDKGTPATQALVNELLTEFDLRYLIMVGICAGFPERKIEIGDVVIANQVFNYERSRLLDSGNEIQAQTYRCSPLIINLARFLKNENAFNEYQKINHIHIKDYACGSKVIANEEAAIRQSILEISNDIVALEMESSGMLHSIWEKVNNANNINVGMIKAVSDLADGDMRDNKTEKQRQAMRSAIGVAMTILENLDDKDIYG